MDKRALGERITQAREALGMTQDGLGRAVGLDRTAITRLESGERKLSAHELVDVARILGRPLTFFVSDPVPAVVSRRANTANVHETTSALDIELNVFAADIQFLLKMGLASAVTRDEGASVPSDHAAAENAARKVRAQLELGDKPIPDLGEVCQRLGLYVFASPFGPGGPDGACVEVGGAATAGLGVAVINGDAPPGRRRMTLAHELGHWLFGDAYDNKASSDSERMINSFAIHFLAPRVGIQAKWHEDRKLPIRDRALAVGASFRLSWSATILQLKNLGLISDEDHRALSESEPRRGDYARLGLSWVDELGSPYVSPGFAALCINGYVSGKLTQDRVVELLRGTLVAKDLPQRKPLTIDALRSAFEGHGD